MEKQILMTELTKYPARSRRKQKYIIQEKGLQKETMMSSSMFLMCDFGFVLPKRYNADKIRSSIALNRDGLKYIRKTEKQMFAQHTEVRDPRKLIRLAGVRSQLSQQIKNKERVLGKR